MTNHSLYGITIQKSNVTPTQYKYYAFSPTLGAYLKGNTIAGMKDLIRRYESRPK